MKQNIFWLTIISTFLAGCSRPVSFDYDWKFDEVSKELQKDWKARKDWKKCGSSIYAVSGDTTFSKAIHHLVICDNNLFNAIILPRKEKDSLEGRHQFLSGSYELLNDTFRLSFERYHKPQILGDKIIYSPDKKYFLWLTNDMTKALKLRIMKPRNDNK